VRWGSRAAIDNHICAATPLDVVSHELSSDLSKPRAGLIIPFKIPIVISPRRGSVADRFDLSHRAILPRFSTRILPMRCNTLILSPAHSGSPLPERFLSRLAGFTDLFTRPTWSNVLVLLAGAILAPGRRNRHNGAAYPWARMLIPDFCTFHRILNRAAWSSRAGASAADPAGKAFVPSGAPVVIGT